MRQSPLRETDGVSGGRNGRRALAGLAAGMASPEQSLRSQNSRESYSHGSYPDHGQSQQESMHQAQMLRHAAYPYHPIPPTQMADAELLTSMRYAPQPPVLRPIGVTITPHHTDRLQHVQRTQAASARSSVVPGTPSERGDESLNTDYEIDDVRRRTPFREYSRPLDQAEDLRRNGLSAAHGGPANRIIAIASSPEAEVHVGNLISPGHPGRPLPSTSSTRPEESLSLEPTQRNEELVSSPIAMPQKQLPTRATPVETRAKAQRPPQAQHHPKPILPRPADTAPETDEDTFIRSQDRKVALKKRSNAEIDACMEGKPLPSRSETVSPNKRKKAWLKQKDVVLGEASEGKKVPGRGELQNRKVTSAMAAIARSAAADVVAEPPPRTTSPVKKKMDVSKPLLQDHAKLKELRDNLFLPADSSTSSMADVTINIASLASRIAPYRRLQKTSAAGSSGPSSEPTSLRGIDSYEKEGDAKAVEPRLEETQVARLPNAEETRDAEQEKSNDAPLNADISRVTASPPSEPTAKEDVEHVRRSRSTSLTPAPDTDDEEPRVETLVVPSPQRYKTYKSPAKKRKIGPAVNFSPSDPQASTSETDESPKRRKAARKQGGPTKKIMSPTASPPTQGKSRGVRSKSSTESLSEAPMEEKWDDMPPPVMKDDPRDRDFRPISHSQRQSSPSRKIATRRKSMTPRPALQFKRVLGLWNGNFYTGTLIGKKNRKYTVQFDDEPSGYDRPFDELRQCVFHVGDEVSLHYSMERKLNESGTFEVLGPVDEELDMASPLLADDVLRLRSKSKKMYEVAVKYCTFDEENEEVLDDRYFDEAQLDEMCAMSDSAGAIKAKKSTKDQKAKLVNGKQAARPILRGQTRSDLRLERSRPLQNFAFVISSNPNVQDKSAVTRNYKAKIIGAGGRVMDDFFDFYPKPRGDRMGADDIVLAKHHLALNGIFLLILPPKEPKAPFLTEKYMMALALGIPCLSATYIDELLNEEDVSTNGSCYTVDDTNACSRPLLGAPFYCLPDCLFN